MFPGALLPTSLIAVLFAIPALAAPDSPNDPFREISLRVPKGEGEPICCLRPLEPLEPMSEDDVLVSFEEWKAKRLGDASSRAPSAQTSVKKGNQPIGSGRDVKGSVSQSASSDIATEPGQAQTPPPEPVPQDTVEAQMTDDRFAPHFLIPINDRFNYAAADCSARVHTAHRSAKSPSAILSSKKDRYMLSPCAEDRQFVVVELCDDIMIDTVQLANYEFFSGVFKDFTVSVAKTYRTDSTIWIHAGTYRAQNKRGVQSFHTPPTLRDFYRFIRIDFHSHYGNEYYCPLSLLHVYGLTHLEQWKWDEWEAESRAQRVVQAASSAVETTADPPQLAHAPIVDIQPSSETVSKDQHYTLADATQTARSVVQTTSTGQVSCDDDEYVDSDNVPASGEPDKPNVETTQLFVNYSLETASSAHSESPTTQQDSESLESHAATTAHEQYLSRSESLSHTPLSSDLSDPKEPLYTTSSASLVNPPTPNTENSEPARQSANVSQSPSQQQNRATTSTTSLTPASSVSSSPSHSTPAPPPPPPPPHVATGGESIYRTIMNRLTALEANTTLYARYVEEQTAGVREILRRLGEDVGRLEGIGNAQSQMYQRSIAEFDRQRRRLEIEHSELLVKVNRLTEEVVLEKRLGIAQLCLLLAVLVFMTLTRGSRGEHIHPVRGISRRLAMRDWGQRTLSLSLSSDWVNRFKSRSPTPMPPEHPQPRPAEKTTDKVDFPVDPDEPRPEGASPTRSRSTQPGPSSRKVGIGARPRTPSALRISTPRHYNHSRPSHHGATHSTPLASLSRPQTLTRSSSGGSALALGGIGPVPRSAKRWARSAHLHEVKSAGVVPSAESAKYTSLSGSVSAGVEKMEYEDDIFGAETTKDAVRDRRLFDARQALSPLRLSSASDLPKGCVHGGPPSEVSEGDGWVDTDVDGSESESGQRYDGDALDIGRTA
ncbi:hypothetical protein WOLCODRAFT_117183 [Wolfiporia cocos MD-104 SS10]|uniref:SUN domain-containing protein n=1 Tax=Wolfiporia cocos (strain MD-104) TaxID=742152 RepID=A0A2H3JNK9_WOLCO|nr:hypothetical protein WOLCODRAFT_117183 [Wolfiporia cocos MD-104 SS10]